MKKQKYAFTLVELIVVITILAILGTIAFISLQGYSAQSRDSVRISDIGNLKTALELSMVNGEKVPKPENSIDITASGTLIGFQGEAGKDTLSILSVFNGGKDPLDDTYYTYTTNNKLTKYQVLGYLEDGTQLSFNGKISETYAKDYSKRYVYTKGNEMGILLDSTTNEPVNKLGGNVDVVNTTSSYKAYFNITDTASGTGGILKALKYSFSSKIEMLMVSCPKGWTESTVNSIGTGPGSANCGNSTGGYSTCKICTSDINSLIPTGTEVLMNSCPTNWSESTTNFIQVGLPGSATCGNSIDGYVPCKVCSSLNDVTISAGAEALMPYCPTSWLESTVNSIGTGPGSATCGNSTDGYNSCKICKKK